MVQRWLAQLRWTNWRTVGAASLLCLALAACDTAPANPPAATPVPPMPTLTLTIQATPTVARVRAATPTKAATGAMGTATFLSDGTTELSGNKEADAVWETARRDYEDGDFDRAISGYTHALQIQPDFAGAYFWRGVAYNGKEDYIKALDDYESALQIKPDYSEVFNNRGGFYGEKGMYAIALNNFNAAIKYHPDFIWA